MGLDLKATGYKGTFHYPYSCYYRVRCEIVRQVYGEEMLDIFMAGTSGENLTDLAFVTWNSQCNDDLDLLILHSDVDGKLTWPECRRVYDRLKDVTITEDRFKNILDAYNDLLAILRYCKDTRHTLWFR